MNDFEQPEAPKRGRPAKVQAERRRRNSDSLGGRRRRLMVDETKLDRENYVYRFANDDERGRIHQLTVQDDWEVVTDREAAIKQDTAGDGSTVSILAGTQGNGAALKTVLLRKPKAYADEDYAARQRRIDETEAGLRRGQTPGSSDDGQMYVPQEGIRMTRG